MGRDQGFTLIELMIVIAIIAVIAAIAIPGLMASQRAANERNASSSLKTLGSAEADFRSNDRDGNKVQDFWTREVAGLYCIKTIDSTGLPIKLIDLSVAAADSDPLAVAAGQYDPLISSYANQTPKSGFWYWALQSDLATSEDYTQATGGSPAVGTDHYHMAMWGFMAYPDVVNSTGKTAYILNEGNMMFKRQLTTQIRPSSLTPPGAVVAPGFTDWPTETMIKTYWAPLD